MKQVILETSITKELLQNELHTLGINHAMLVCDRAMDLLPYERIVRQLPQICCEFCGFTSNPDFRDVQQGISLFCSNGCDGLLAIGGGSAIDVAKCMKAFVNMDCNSEIHMESIQPAKIPLLAIPTTAGTGSESTHFAVVYVKGKKQSVAHEALLPDRVLLDASALKGLPEYQKKCTLMDAMCQAIESWWNVNRTEESVTYAKEALQRSLANRQAYLQGEEVAAHEMLRAANLAGRAINITKTTAPHAMSYKLTSLYGLSHGHAVALCLPEVWRHMIAHWDQCVDTKGGVFVQQVCDEIAHALGQPTQEAAIHWLESLITEMGLEKPKPKQLSVELKLLAASVDPVRLGNHPVRITQDEFYHMYEHILHTEA